MCCACSQGSVRPSLSVQWLAKGLLFDNGLAVFAVESIRTITLSTNFI